MASGKISKTELKCVGKQVTIPANADYVNVTADTIDGYSFVCWLSVATDGFVGSAYAVGQSLHKPTYGFLTALLIGHVRSTLQRYIANYNSFITQSRQKGMATGKIEKVITQEKLHYYNIVNICPHWDGTNMFIDFFITEEAYYRFVLGSNNSKSLYLDYYDGKTSVRVWTATVK